MRKRKLLTAAVVLAAVLLIALILFLSGRKTQEERFTGGADTLYPYAWTEAKNGTVLVEPCGEIPAGFGWTIAEADAAVIAVSPQDLEGRQAFPWARATASVSSPWSEQRRGRKNSAAW